MQRGLCMTSKYFSLVKTVLSENSNIDVEIQPSGLNGLLKWDGKDPQRGSVIGISSDIKLAKNSIINGIVWSSDKSGDPNRVDVLIA